METIIQINNIVSVLTFTLFLFWFFSQTSSQQFSSLRFSPRAAHTARGTVST